MKLRGLVSPKGLAGMRLLRGGLGFLLRPGLCRGPDRPLYEQGQSPSPRAREYFYYVDHQGQLFLDDAKVKNFITCFKGHCIPRDKTSWRTPAQGASG